ncbi:unnamed protein product [Lampetra planeri]
MRGQHARRATRSRSARAALSRLVPELAEGSAGYRARCGLSPRASEYPPSSRAMSCGTRRAVKWRIEVGSPTKTETSGAPRGSLLPSPIAAVTVARIAVNCVTRGYQLLLLQP